MRADATALARRFAEDGDPTGEVPSYIYLVYDTPDLRPGDLDPYQMVPLPVEKEHYLRAFGAILIEVRRRTDTFGALRAVGYLHEKMLVTLADGEDETDIDIASHPRRVDVSDIYVCDNTGKRCHARNWHGHGGRGVEVVQSWERRDPPLSDAERSPLWTLIRATPTLD